MKTLVLTIFFMFSSIALAGGPLSLISKQLLQRGSRMGSVRVVKNVMDASFGLRSLRTWEKKGTFLFGFKTETGKIIHVSKQIQTPRYPNDRGYVIEVFQKYSEAGKNSQSFGFTDVRLTILDSLENEGVRMSLTSSRDINAKVYNAYLDSLNGKKLTVKDRIKPRGSFFAYDEKRIGSQFKEEVIAQEFVVSGEELMSQLDVSYFERLVDDLNWL